MNRFGYVSLVAIFAAIASPLAAEPPSASLLAEIRGGWSAYLPDSSASYREVTQRSVVPDAGGGTLWSSSETKLWCTNDGEMFETISKDSEGQFRSANVEGRNPRYTFRLIKHTSAGEWAIEKVEPIAGPMERTMSGGNLTSIGFAHTAPKILDDPNMDFYDVERDESSATVVLRFRRRPGASGDAKPFAISSGEMTLDSDNFFVIRKAAIRGTPATNFETWEIENEYEPREGKVPVFVRGVLRETRDGNRLEVYHEAVVWDEDRKVPASRFTLSSYGFPEPPDLRTPGTYRTPMWIYYFIGGVLLTAAGAAAAYLGTKRFARA